jgi:hypothetical protein
MAEAYTRDQMAYGFGRGFTDWLWLPWRVAMTPLNALTPFWPLTYAAMADKSAIGLFETPGNWNQTVLGPALLAFGLPLVFIKRKPWLVGFILWSFVFFWVFWAKTGQYLRYLLPAFALLCLPCGWGLTGYLRRSALLKWSATVALAAWMLFAPAYDLWLARDEFSVITGARSPEDYLQHTLPPYEVMHWASTNTPASARFAVYGEPRCFYLERDYFWADQLHNLLLDYSTVHTGADLVRALKARGATHVIWNQTPDRNGGVFGPPPQISEAIDEGLLVRIYEARNYVVLRLSDPNGGVRP